MPLIKIENKRLGQYKRSVPVALIEVTCCAECPYMAEEGNYFRCPFTDALFNFLEIKRPGLPPGCYLLRYQEYVEAQG